MYGGRSAYLIGSELNLGQASFASALGIQPGIPTRPSKRTSRFAPQTIHHCSVWKQLYMAVQTATPRSLGDKASNKRRTDP